MLSNNLIKRLKKDSDFQEFLDYIVEIIDDIDSIGSFNTGVNNELLGEQLRAKIVSREQLLLILRPFIDFNERKKPTKEQIAKTKLKFGL